MTPSLGKPVLPSSTTLVENEDVCLNLAGRFSTNRLRAFSSASASGGIGWTTSMSPPRGDSPGLVDERAKVLDLPELTIGAAGPERYCCRIEGWRK